jgi:hypothetical protein
MFIVTFESGNYFIFLGTKVYHVFAPNLQNNRLVLLFVSYRLGGLFQAPVEQGGGFEGCFSQVFKLRGGKLQKEDI